MTQLAERVAALEALCASIVRELTAPEAPLVTAPTEPEPTPKAPSE